MKPTVLIDGVPVDLGIESVEYREEAGPRCPICGRPWTTGGTTERACSACMGMAIRANAATSCGIGFALDLMRDLARPPVRAAAERVSFRYALDPIAGNRHERRVMSATKRLRLFEGAELERMEPPR